MLRNVGGLHASRMSRKWEARQHDHDDSENVNNDKPGRRPSNIVEVHMAMDERDNDGHCGPHQASAANAASLDGTDSIASGSAHPARHRQVSRHNSTLSGAELATNAAQAGSSVPSSVRTSFTTSTAR